MAVNKPIVLPAKKLVFDAINFFFATDAYIWKSRPLRASDSPDLPIAWTSYQQSLYEGVSEAAWLASNASINPPRWYATQNCPVKLPKLVLCDMSSFNVNNTFVPATTVMDLATVFSSISADLLANKIMVAKASTNYETGSVLFTMFLPHYDENDFTDTNVHFADAVFTLPTVEASDWVGGQILYLGAMNIIGWPTTPAGLGARADLAGANNFFFPYTNNLAAETAQIIACYERYEKFGYHLLCSLPTNDGGEADYPATSLLFRANVTDAVAALAAYGVTATIFDGDYLGTYQSAWPAQQAAIEADMVAKVVAFFGL